jgi:hypothetical protein
MTMAEDWPADSPAVEPSSRRSEGTENVHRDGSLPGTVDRTELEWDGPGHLVFEPALHQVGPRRFLVEGRSEIESGIPWGFWGGVLALGALLLLLANAASFWTMWDFLWAALAILVGVFLYRYGRRSSLGDVVLLDIDIGWGAMRWPADTVTGEGAERVVELDDVTEVVFGMTRMPVTARSRDVRVDAFTLLVRTREDHLIPVIEGSPYKGEVHDIGRFLADKIGCQLTYVGRGIQS